MTKAYSHLFSQLRQVGGMLGPSRWTRRLSSPAAAGRRIGLPVDKAAKLLTLIAIAVISALVYTNFEKLEATRDAMKASPWGAAFLIVGEVFIAYSACFFLWKLWLLRRYKAYPECADADLPTLTVVVPAYNEGRQVMVTLRSLAASNYPPEKLQIIAVDDGSKDDTWHWICQAQRELRERVLSLRLPQNRGKRHALYAGFRRATGDILITVDSDSIVDPYTLRRMTSPFKNNPQLGAVAGNVRVLNMHEGIFPQMLDVSFVYSFDFNRASQSQTDTVLCTPGALSAYRRDLVEKVIDEWLHQTYFGRPAGIGEDRAMTNLILRQGFHVHFQQNATVYTNVPVHYRNLTKMYIRWCRSDVRENVAMHEFIFSTWRKGSLYGTRLNLFNQWVGCTIVPVFLLVAVGLLCWQPGIMLLNTLGGIAMWSTAPCLFYLFRHKTTDALWAYAYGMFYFFALSWIVPFSLVTSHQSGWLTRTLPQATPATVPAALSGSKEKAA